MLTFKNDRIIRACKGLEVDRTPVWLMRQAGRYLPEYMEIRKNYNFVECCYTPELAATFTLQPLKRFDLDAVVYFSDILVIPKAMGFEFHMEPKVGPVFTDTLKIDEVYSRINYDDITDKLEKIYEGIDETIKRLDGEVPLIGFAGAPWTLMCYIVHGSGEIKNKQKFETALKWCYENKKEAHHVLDVLSEHISRHLIEQVDRGCGLLQLFDSWASCMTPQLYQEFGIPYIKKILDKVKTKHPDVPIIVFSKGANDSIEELSLLNADVLGIDYYISLSTARKLVGGRVSLQGNLDPLILKCDDDIIINNIKRMLKEVGNPRLGYIANLGHGCLPDFKPEKVKLFVDTIHKYSEEGKL